MAQANFQNPRKQFQWRIKFDSLKGNEFEFQTCTLPNIEVDQTEHGETNNIIKTPGIVHFSNLVLGKLKPNNANDAALRAWIHSCQNAMLGIGLPASIIKDNCTVDLVNESGLTVESHTLTGVWPCIINGLELSRVSSDNVIENIEFAVDYYESPSSITG